MISPLFTLRGLSVLTRHSEFASHFHGERPIFTKSSLKRWSLRKSTKRGSILTSATGR
jgi:hypothetical protein